MTTTGAAPTETGGQEGGTGTHRTVLISVDDSEQSEKAFDYYVNNLHRAENKVLCFHVSQPPYISPATSVVAATMELEMMHTGCKDGGHLVICQYNNDNNLTRTQLEDGALNWNLPAYNISINNTTYQRAPGAGGGIHEEVFSIWQLLVTFYTPALTTVGVSGNILMAGILISSQLQRNSANHYLAAAMLTDAIYLVGLLLLWLENVGTDLYNRKGWCQFISFISRVSSFLSLWLMVAFSVDRLIVHVSPRRSAQLCTPFRAKLVILALVIVAVVVFVNISLTVGVVSHYGVPRCVPLMRFVRQLRHLDLVDSLFNVVIPYMLMVGVLPVLSRYVVSLRSELDDPQSHGVVEMNQKETTFQSRPYRLTTFSTLLLLLFIAMRIPSDSLRLIHSLRNALNNFSPTPWAAMGWLVYLSPVFDATFAMKPYLVLTIHPDFRRCLGKVTKKLRLCCCKEHKMVDKIPVTSLEEDERENNNAEPQEV